MRGSTGIGPVFPSGGGDAACKDRKPRTAGEAGRENADRRGVAIGHAPPAATGSAGHQVGTRVSGGSLRRTRSHPPRLLSGTGPCNRRIRSHRRGRRRGLRRPPAFALTKPSMGLVAVDGAEQLPCQPSGVRVLPVVCHLEQGQDSLQQWGPLPVPLGFHRCRQERMQTVSADPTRRPFRSDSLVTPPRPHDRSHRRVITSMANFRPVVQLILSDRRRASAWWARVAGWRGSHPTRSGRRRGRWSGRGG